MGSFYKDNTCVKMYYSPVVFRMQIVVVVLVCSHVWGAACLSYCNITCHGQRHTMCEYRPGGPPSCNKYRAGVSAEEKRLVVSLHNRVRQKVANGFETGGANFQGSNMREISWDEELSRVAQRWADQCTRNGHDHCRDSKDHTPVGQNVVTGKVFNFNVSKLFNQWYIDERYFPRLLVDSFQHSNIFKKVGHFTQIVWADTTHVGCGMARSPDSYKFVCNYKPSGNVIGKPIYKRGRPCSGCPTRYRCSITYPGLCSTR